MKPYLDLILSVLTFLTLALGLYFAIRRFGLKRERFSFLNLTIDTKTIQDVGEVKLVSIVVTLENKGETRVNARRERGTDGFLYNDGWDQCMHAGTLKIRPIPVEKEPLLFDWYSLEPMRARISQVKEERGCIAQENLEQINYLGDFQDPQYNYEEVDFWLEPKESYAICVPVWLRSGIYCVKAFFLGPRKKYQDDEYWSHIMIFRVDADELPNRVRDDI
jgi:hypothetical protein